MHWEEQRVAIAVDTGKSERYLATAIIIKTLKFAVSLFRLGTVCMCIPTNRPTCCLALALLPCLLRALSLQERSVAYPQCCPVLNGIGDLSSASNIGQCPWNANFAMEFVSFAIAAVKFPDHFTKVPCFGHLPAYGVGGRAGCLLVFWKNRANLDVQLLHLLTVKAIRQIHSQQVINVL